VKDSYLVYYASSTTIDDPEDDELVNIPTQLRFRDLIARYGDQLVHTVYVHHEGRVWIYRRQVWRTSRWSPTPYIGEW
jgi:hypothetical protein